MSQVKFDAAVNVIRSLPKDGPYQPSHDMMLRFYSLYKQATEGPCKEPKPAFYEIVKGYKWKAWTSLGSMSKIKAMESYVEELKKIIETMSYSTDVAKFIEALGPFYEYVEVPEGKLTDTNHNMTEKSIDKMGKRLNELSPNGDALPIMNGNHLPSGSNYDRKDDFHLVNGNEISSNRSSTSALSQDLVNDIQVNGYLYHETSGASFNGIAKSSAVSDIAKLVIDTDTDEEEYSEPAETPELLLQEKKYVFNSIDKAREPCGNEIIESSNAYVNGHFEYSNNREVRNESPILEIVTCGGGDATEAGRIRLTSPYQKNQGSTSSPGRIPTDEGSSMPHPSQSGGSGGRRRDSDRSGNKKITEDINAQLVLLLQKIHQDLQNVVLRLDSLESQAFSQHQEICSLCQRRVGRPYSSPMAENSWWPFPELSPRSTFFLLTWPLILHGAVKLLLLLKSRRRNRTSRL